MTSVAKRSISAQGANKVLEAAHAKAKAMGVSMCISVTDETGDLKAFLRMDGAIKISVDISMNKAFTSASTGLATNQWHDFIKDDPPLLHGLTHTPRFVIFGGGVPLKEGDAVIGAIGVSGGHYTQDMEVAEAGAKALG
jgi:uncharacterized protein GlcG (DUF336 family)